MEHSLISIIGCGITGCVMARECAEKGYAVTVYDRRSHIGGNLYDERDEHGILVHRYGPHAFHTNSERVWSYVRRFGEWVPYTLVCGASIDGICVPTAFNFVAVDTFFQPAEAQEIKQHLSACFPQCSTVPILELLDCEDAAVRRYARFLYEKDYAPYAAKQWATPPERLDRSIFSRVPVRLDYRNAYFDDRYQAMPKDGYTAFIAKILDHPNIRVCLGEQPVLAFDYSEKKILLQGEEAERIIYTGALDDLFNYQHGVLPYRSLRFEWQYEEKDSFQPLPVVAYPEAKSYTRITEYKKLPPQQVSGTTYAIEYPLPFLPDHSEQEPYYPVLTPESQAAYRQYTKLASHYTNLTCCGRLADFKYYNMDQAIEAAINLASVAF